MADPNAIIPFDDPFDSPFSENIFNFVDNQIPNFLDFPPELLEPNSYPPLPVLQSSDNNNDTIADPIDPLEDPIMWGMYDGTNFNSSQAGPSEIRGESSNPEEVNGQPPDFGYGNGNSMPLSIWPAPVVPFLCSCCQILREIVHTNGNHTVKLEVHGRLGMICHAILENLHDVYAVPRSKKYKMFDFSKKSIENVKQFLVQYCEERKQAGYILLQDPLSFFYEAVCVGLDWDENLNTNEFFDKSPMDSGPSQVNQPDAENNEERMPKSSLAAQRERTGKLTLRDLVPYFHLPIEEAAKQLNICPTVVKKICRKHGLNRWPYRKIKSIERQITMLRVSLDATDAEESARVQAEIERLQQEMATICAGLFQ